MSRSAVMGWFGLLVAGLAGPAVTAGVPPPTQAEVEQAVIAAIPAWQGQQATILKYLDLTRPFDTASPWALVVAKDPRLRPSDPMPGDEDNPIAVCFVEALSPHCSEFHERVAVLNGEPSWYAKWYAKSYQPARMFGLLDARVVHAGRDRTMPLLLLKTSIDRAVDGNTDIRTILYGYDRKANRFDEVFVNDSAGSNNNQDARFIESGPLQGDEVVDFPTEHPPYVYWVEVYAPHGSGAYRRILRYRSVTHYGDGNPLPVADSEMPQIMERLGLWKTGDALPIPPHEPNGCGPLVMRRGEEWCKTLRIAMTPQR
ncbi:MAG: hypothetical protein OJF55_001317 [Rhodanobacteraceae bacterium]|jgi:hypothetical protein|nr:MAG: hypothetical protein OJF55_001317 [Rhodanobacteraceae bacterium]